MNFFKLISYCLAKCRQSPSVFALLKNNRFRVNNTRRHFRQRHKPPINLADKTDPETPKPTPRESIRALTEKTDDLPDRLGEWGIYWGIYGRE